MGVRRRFPRGADWEDHAVPCPNCGCAVMSDDEHLSPADDVDPAWWNCDNADEERDANVDCDEGGQFGMGA